jgi:hypothetical protein
MTAKEFKNLKLPAFIDQFGTKFIKGPFEIDGVTFDYKLIDKDGEDFCTAEQMENWYIDIVNKAKVDERDNLYRRHEAIFD